MSETFDGNGPNNSFHSDTEESDALGMLYTDSLNTFGTFLIECSQHHHLLQTSGLERCFEEYSRLKLWGIENRASLSASVPGSLASTLQSQPELRDTVAETFNQIIDSIKQVTSILPDCSEEDFDFIESSDWNSDDSSSSSSHNSHDGVVQKPHIPRLLGYVFETVKELYRFSTLLRRSRLAGRYLHSNRPDDSVSFHQQDYQHIRQKCLLWQKQRIEENLEDSPRPTTPKEEETTTPAYISRRQQDEATSNELEFVLSRRIAIANKRRRLQLRYWEAHPYRLVEGAQHLGPKSSKAETADESSRSIKGKALLENVELKSVNYPPTAHSFSTVAKSAILPDAGRVGVSGTQYAPTVVDRNGHASIRVPTVPVPRSTGVERKTTFDCPYCRMTLDNTEMSNRLFWKRHVFRDLRPYTCTFSECMDPNKLYATRHDWIYHEMQVHRRQWNCQACDNVAFFDKAEMATHLRKIHSSFITENQIPVLLDMSERPMDQATRASCPFCSENMSLKRLLVHMAEHMENLALFSLPLSIEETKAAGSISARKLGSGDSSNHDELSNFSFHTRPSASLSDTEDAVIYSRVWLYRGRTFEEMLLERYELGKERLEMIRELQIAIANRLTASSLIRLLIVEGKLVNLHQLFLAVAEIGSFKRATATDDWHKIGVTLGFTQASTGNKLKDIYEGNLLPLEVLIKTGDTRPDGVVFPSTSRENTVQTKDTLVDEQAGSDPNDRLFPSIEIIRGTYGDTVSIEDVICLLDPISESAKNEARFLAHSAGNRRFVTPYTINPDAGDRSQTSNQYRGIEDYAIVLKRSAKIKDPTLGFTFGRNVVRCDIPFTNDPKRRLSNIHFRIYVTEDGTVMLEDQSVNGTVVDDVLLKESQSSTLRTSVLNNNSTIKIIMAREDEDLVFRVQIPRKDQTRAGEDGV